MNQLAKFVVQEPSISGEIRRTLVTWAHDLGFDETKIGKISIVVNELSSNILKHAGHGEIICTSTENSIEIMALDKGPGMANPSQCFKDGFSTQGTQGTGLGAIKRQSTHFDIFTQVYKGTVVFSQFVKSPDIKLSKIDYAGLSVPYPGETLCGDGWKIVEDDDSLKVLVSDGLGHGLFAHEATQMALRSFSNSPHRSPLEDINLLHNGLRSSRGAAVAVAYVDFKERKVDYAGLGNISSAIFSDSNSKRLISYNGITGVQMRKVQPMTYPMEENSVFILFSDGLATHWNLSDYIGLQFKPSHLIAAVLYRDHARNSDDVTIVVMKVRE